MSVMSAMLLMRWEHRLLWKQALPIWIKHNCCNRQWYRHTSENTFTCNKSPLHRPQLTGSIQCDKFFRQVPYSTVSSHELVYPIVWELTGIRLKLPNLSVVRVLVLHSLSDQRRARDLVDNVTQYCNSAYYSKKLVNGCARANCWRALTEFNRSGYFPSLFRPPDKAAAVHFFSCFTFSTLPQQLPW